MNTARTAAKIPKATDTDWASFLAGLPVDLLAEVVVVLPDDWLPPSVGIVGRPEVEDVAPVPFDAVGGLAEAALQYWRLNCW